MVVEKLIPKKGEYIFPAFIFITSKEYRYHPNQQRVFHFQYEYWYDGRLFLVGHFKGEKLSLMDVETCSFAVGPAELAKPTAKTLIEKFKDKVQMSGKTIHEVAQNFKNLNLDLELWVVKSLIV